MIQLLQVKQRLAGFIVAVSISLAAGCANHAATHSKDATAHVATPTTPHAPGGALAAATHAKSSKPGAISASQPTAPAPAQLPPAVGENGRIVAAPSNIRSFSPDESSLVSAVAADKVNLRKIFEDLGPDATLWYQHVQTLANPFLEGRAPGTRGGELAAEYIEFYMKMYGLEPAFPTESAAGGDHAKTFARYTQPFDFESPNPDVKVIATAAAINGQSLADGIEFTVLANSGNGDITGPISFCGYAIAEGKDGYSSFDQDTDLTGRIALVLRYEPLDEQGKSQWSAARFSRNSSIAPKMKSLADRHAAGIILVNPPGAADGKAGLESLKESGRFGKRLDIPAFQVTPEVAERILKQADPQHRDLMAWRRLADTGEVKTINLDDTTRVSISSNLEVRDRLATQNVAGILRGKGALADQWVVIGAHYDHLGYGYTGMRSPSNAGKLHPGADDNASGTAGVLITARRMALDYDKAGANANLRSIVFITFSAEEAGLLGSKYFVDHPPIPADATTLMINMDMIGRLRSDNLLVQGASTAEGLADLLKPLYESSGLRISVMPGGRGPSDHSSFYDRNIPVLFLFTGEHAEYHEPSDRAYTVNPAGAMKVLDLLEAIAMDVSARSEKLTFAKPGAHATAPAGDAASAASPGEAPSGGPPRPGIKVSLGTRPDYGAQLETGMRVEDVTEGSAAAEAGIQAGDILLTWNGEELTSAAKLADFLGKHEPGDKVKIGLLRGDKEMFVEATLRARAPQ